MKIYNKLYKSYVHSLLNFYTHSHSYPHPHIYVTITQINVENTEHSSRSLMSPLMIVT